MEEGKTLKIVFLDANTIGTDIDCSVFNKLGDFTSYPYTSYEETESRIKDADIIITNKVILNQSNLKNAKRLKLICLTATGMNNIDLEYTSANNIQVKNVKGYCTDSVAQHTFAMLFYLYESLSYYDEYVKSGKYINDKSFTHFDKKFNELNQKNWGVIGLGEIGKKVSDIAKAFGCNTMYYSTSGKNQNPNYTQVSLEELLKTSDIISIHAPLNTQTNNLITHKELSLMKPTAILLNLGRGSIINESDLTKALQNNQIKAAGLDVLSFEPMKEDNPLIKLKNSNNLYITPHIGWASIEARKRVIEEVYKNIVNN